MSERFEDPRALSNAELARRAAREYDAGAPGEAWGVLWERHYAFIEERARSSAARYAPPWVDHDDFCQEVLTRVSVRMPYVVRQYRGDAPFRHFLAVVIRRAVLDARKHVGRSVVEADTDHIAEVPDGQSGKPLEEADLEKVRAALTELQAQEVAIFIRHHVDGETAPEIAARLGLNADAVAQRISRTKRRIKEILKRKFNIQRFGDLYNPPVRMDSRRPRRHRDDD